MLGFFFMLLNEEQNPSSNWRNKILPSNWAWWQSS